MIPTFATFLRCLRTASSTAQMKRCVNNYQALDWFSGDLYVDHVPSSRLHCSHPLVHTYSFSDSEQTVHVEPGLVAMLDGKCLVGSKPLHLNQSRLLQRTTTIQSLHPYATLLHVAHLPYPNEQHAAAWKAALRID